MTTRFKLERAAEEMGLNEVMSSPVRWLTKEIKAGRIPAKKIGRYWTMTRAEMDAAEEAWSTTAKPAVAESAPRSGLSAASQRRRLAS